jgi:hypothetical protein
MCLLPIHLKRFGLETNCSLKANYGVKVILLICHFLIGYKRHLNI